MSDKSSSSFNATGDFSKSMDQLCYQLSYANVKIVPFTACANVFEFINEFELATAGLSEAQRLTLLAKGFPPGRFRSWFENDLQPIIEGQGSWKDAKVKLKERFAGPTDQDRHFKRLRELSYDPNAGQSLTEFVDEVIYSYRKAHDGHENDALLIKHVKACLPSEVITSLSVYSDYREAKTSDQLKKAIREYDSHRGSPGHKTASDRATMAEFSNMFQELLKGMKQEQEATRNTIVAAFKSQEDRQKFTPSQGHVYRGKSPQRNNYQQSNMQNDRDWRGPRPPTPPVRQQSHYGNRTPPRSHSPVQGGDQLGVFDVAAYYERFGKPPSPCNNCGLMHWSRHCHLTLN